MANTSTRKAMLSEEQINILFTTDELITYTLDMSLSYNMTTELLDWAVLEHCLLVNNIIDIDQDEHRTWYVIHKDRKVQMPPI